MPIDPTPFAEGYATPAEVQNARETARWLLTKSQEPVKHWTMGLANMANALVSGLGRSRANELERQALEGVSDRMFELGYTKKPEGRGGLAPSPSGTLPSTSTPALPDEKEPKAKGIKTDMPDKGVQVASIDGLPAPDTAPTEATPLAFAEDTSLTSPTMMAQSLHREAAARGGRAATNPALGGAGKVSPELSGPPVVPGFATATPEGGIVVDPRVTAGRMRMDRGALKDLLRNPYAPEAVKAALYAKYQNQDQPIVIPYGKLGSWVFGPDGPPVWAPEPQEETVKAGNGMEYKRWFHFQPNAQGQMEKRVYPGQNLLGSKSVSPFQPKGEDLERKLQSPDRAIPGPTGSVPPAMPVPPAGGLPTGPVPSGGTAEGQQPDEAPFDLDVGTNQKPLQLPQRMENQTTTPTAPAPGKQSASGLASQENLIPTNTAPGDATRIGNTGKSPLGVQVASAGGNEELAGVLPANFGEEGQAPQQVAETAPEEAVPIQVAQATPLQTAQSAPQTDSPFDVMQQMRDFDLEQKRKEKLAVKDAEELKKFETNAFTAGLKGQKLVQDLDYIKDIVHNPEFITGWWADERVKLAKMGAAIAETDIGKNMLSMGINPMGYLDPRGGSLNDKFNKVIQQALINQLTQAFTGLGQIRVMEIVMLQQAAANQQNTREANVDIVEMMQRASKDLANIGKLTNDYMRGIRWDEKGKVRKNPDGSAEISTSAPSKTELDAFINRYTALSPLYSKEEQKKLKEYTGQSRPPGGTLEGTTPPQKPAAKPTPQENWIPTDEQIPQGAKRIR